MPRDNLLNSACLELFEFIKRENVKPMITHVVENYREKLEYITYVDVFQELILRYDQMQGYNPEMEGTLFGQEEDSSTPAVPARMNGASQRWQGVREMDAAEEEYFNTSDDEDELATVAKAKPHTLPSTITNGASPLVKPLVDYPDDDSDENTEIRFTDFSSKTHSPSTLGKDTRSPTPTNDHVSPSSPHTTIPVSTTHSPLERLSEKRRREEDEEDELGKLSLSKRRTSSIASTNSNPTNFLRRKKSFTNAREANGGGGGGGGGGKKIAISLAVKSAIEAEGGGGDGG